MAEGIPAQTCTRSGGLICGSVDYWLLDEQWSPGWQKTCTGESANMLILSDLILVDLLPGLPSTTSSMAGENVRIH
ncbi:hypothetical protein AV530_006286 [Patagioenas fasciata monilis]|uniref:Uncharacterized protein n=1 Tax=Patagioenas fasciata monilis TaxID=372326 RepID=A0A1V4KG72_PATFA|nr:hypothetical protein AV530_006286 [Patagioenas fasciata monilis]